MALGGGTFVSQNKILPGSYINFISLASADAALSDRGVAAMALDLDWGVDGEVFVVTREDFTKRSQEVFGYDYGHEKMKGLRDLFLNIHTLITYKLSSGGVKAQNVYATAKHAGTRGNDLKIAIQPTVDNPSNFEVITYLGTRAVDEQIVSKETDLVSNAYVTFKPGLTLGTAAATPLTGGTNGTVDGASHQSFLDKAESYSYNAMGVVSDEVAINKLYATHAKRMRDERGQKFQVVVYNEAADFEGVVNVKNAVAGEKEAALVYWVTGIVAGTAVNASALNRIYDGEFDVNVEYTQTELEQAIQAGEFTLHRVGSDIRVLNDINSLVTFTPEKGRIFQDNQTIRVIDQIANDIASLFANKYLGQIPNDQSGRVSLQSDIVTHHLELQALRAIEAFSEDDVTVELGNDKKSVIANDAVTIINTMEKLYMSVIVQ